MQVHVSRFIVVAVILSGLGLSQGVCAEQESKTKTRTVQFRDPRTGRAVTREVPFSDPNDASAAPRSYRTIQTRDPRTGRTITQQVPVTDGAALVKLRVQRYRDRLEFSDEQWQQVEPLLTMVMELQAALKPVSAARYRTAVPDDALRRTPQNAGDPAAALKAAYEALTEAAHHPDATDEEISRKVQACTQKRQEVETELQAAKLQLSELLTARQQARLILEGVL